MLFWIITGVSFALLALLAHGIWSSIQYGKTAQREWETRRTGVDPRR
jgi:hypothetical protein